jgi:hypothetical protein
MGSRADRLKGQLKRVTAERDAMKLALVAITTLSGEESVIRAQQLAANVIGVRYLSSVTVVNKGKTPITVAADGEVLALCPECQKPHRLGSDTEPS